jgi:hypothetical protein
MGSVVLVVVVVLAVVVGAFVWMAVRVRRTGDADAAASRQMLDAELSVLADDVLSLDSAVTAHPEARPDYDAAVSRYRAAQAAFESARGPQALAQVERMVGDASYSMSRARAIVEGRPPPAAPPAPPAPPLARGNRPGVPPVVVVRGRPRFGGGGRMRRRMRRGRWGRW